MADKQIGDLTAAGALTGTELVHVVQSGNSRRTTAQDIADLGGGGDPFIWTDLTWSADGSSKWAGTAYKSQAFTASDGDVFELEIGWDRDSSTDELIYISGDANKSVRLATQSDNNIVTYSHSSTGDVSGTTISGGSNILSGFNGTQRWLVEFNASSAGGQYWTMFWNKKLDKSGRADNGTVPVVGSDLRIYLNSGIPDTDIKYARIRKKPQ